jgi:hypothetical protein
VNVSADFLPRLSRAKDADDGDIGFLGALSGADIVAKLGVVSGGRGLVVIDAIQSDAENIHAGLI